jgi:hypothetical protein
MPRPGFGRTTRRWHQRQSFRKSAPFLEEGFPSAFKTQLLGFLAISHKEFDHPGWAGQSYPHLVFALEFLLPRLKAEGFLPFPFVNNELRLGREYIYSIQTAFLRIRHLSRVGLRWFGISGKEICAASIASRTSFAAGMMNGSVATLELRRSLAITSAKLDRHRAEQAKNEAME